MDGEFELQAKVEDYNRRKREVTIAAVNDLVMLCHAASHNAGWWHDPITGRALIDDPFTTPTKLMLTVSELSEAMEADRRGAMDDKLSDLTGLEVELADAVIRIFDLAGAKGYRLGSTILRKIGYNDIREDHKIDTRRKPGGKLY